jgi:hypothetical protein
MAFRQSKRAFIDLRVDDIVQGDTRFGQVARFFRLEHEQDPDTGICKALIKCRLLVFSLVNGALNEQLPRGRFVVLEPDLVGDNDTLVDAATGQILAIRYQTPATEDPAMWGQVCHCFENRDVMLQGDWFEEQRDGAAIPVGGWILANMQQAQRMGRFS